MKNKYKNCYVSNRIKKLNLKRTILYNFNDNPAKQNTYSRIFNRIAKRFSDILGNELEREYNKIITKS